MKCYGIKINGKLDPNSIESSEYFLYGRYRQTIFDQYLNTDKPDVEMVEFELNIKRTIPKKEMEKYIEQTYSIKR